jgi:hypothetical protein
MSSRKNGSPPLNTSTGTFISARESMNDLASAVDSSSLSRSSQAPK